MSKKNSGKELVTTENKSEKPGEISTKVENKPEKSENVSAKSESKSESAIVVWWKDTLQFLREVWIEVRPNKGRVTWPTWASVKVSTKVVIIASIGLGLFIGLCDAVFATALKAIISSFTSGGGLG
jgi:preprotein translocase SecE subunit